MNIGDVFLVLRAEGAKFQAEAVKEAEKAGDAAGKTLGSRVGRAASLAFKGGLAVLSAGAALATRGLLELEQIQADFTAETGATADEAKRAGQAINEMSGRNIQPMREIGQALTKVHTDLGLTGAEAEATAEAFLKFARATKQDAGAAVVAFDDILDAWGLTAADAQGVMDNLVASHQKYGGSITENQKSLSNLAPQLKALNLGVDDGIGLLNLFAASGLDASKAQFALNSAIQKLPPGTSFEEFIVHLASIEDPAQRAREAIEVFGARGGAGLANTLRPGMQGLDDFKLSTQEMTGATQEAADALDSTFGARAQLLIKGFASKLIELGGAFGPAVTGLASLTTLAGALGFGGLTKKLTAGLAGAWKAVAASSLVTGAISAASSIAATLYLKALYLADALTGAIRGAWVKSGASAVVGGAIAKAGALAATAYLKVLIFGDMISGAISGAWGRVAGTGSKATMAAGAAGKAAGLAFSIGMLLFIAKLAEEIEPHLQKLAAEFNIWGDDPPFDLHPEEWPWPLGPKGAPDWAGGAAEAEAGAAAIAAGVGRGMSDAAIVAHRAGERIPFEVADGLASGESIVTDGAEKLTSGIPNAVRDAKGTATTIAATIPGALSSALRDDRTAWQRAWDQLKEDAENSMSTTVEIAKIQGKLAKIAASEGWESGDPVWIQSLKDTQAILEARLAELEPAAKKDGKDANKGLAEGLTDGNAPARAAWVIRNEIKGVLDNIPTFKWGFQTGKSYVEGMAAALNNTQSIEDAMYYIRRLVYANTPPKYRESPLYGVDRWGDATGEAYVSGMAQGLVKTAARVRDAVAGLIAPMMVAPPEFRTPAIAFAGAAALDHRAIPTLATQSSATTGGITIGDIHVDARGAKDPQGVGNAVRQAVMDATAEGLRQQTARLPIGTRA